MFGRGPILHAPNFAPSFPVFQGHAPAQPPAQPPAPRPFFPLRQPQPPASPANMTAAAPPVAAPKIRLQSPDEVVPSHRLTLPAPEQLGVTAARAPSAPPAPAALDWNATRERLNRLGAVGFYLNKEAGGFRVTFVLPTGEPGRTHHIEVAAATEATAVGMALDRAERWAGQKQ